MSEKTEQPTPQRLRKARREGQFARSRLLTGAFVTLGGVMGLCAAGPEAAARLQSWTAGIFLRQDLSVEAAALGGLTVLAWFVGPALAGSFAGALLSATPMAGFELNVAHVAPKLERISPAGGLKRLFGVRQLVDTAKNLAIAALIAALLWSSVRSAAREVFAAVWLDGSASLGVVVALLRPVVVKLTAVIVILGGFDYLLARRRHTKDLMMSREEIKQEYKNNEGDPHTKSKRKALARQIAMSGPARGVHKASAVVVNPTHIAVAIRYEPSECEAPYLVAKGRDEDALAIRREAKRQGIPVVKDVPLARSLIHYDVGEEIPEELYQAAAAVLKVAMETQEADARPRSRTP
ncbi:MAG: EscU/YscU/HrcU family type III secretion system export apparatus switch protein [Myxococcaceae bacterium]|nr:EscU/YscU/HrcU family type III secretion system export apparatus switch protein [Myxococcaceae bacterium]